jgi:hypothetical protein
MSKQNSLTDEQIGEAVALYDGGLSLRKIQGAIGVNRETIRRALHGRTRIRPRIYAEDISLQARLEKYILPEPMSGCWLWDGNTYHAFGYGIVSYKGKQHTTSRLAWMAYRGPIPDEMHVLHKCDNPACLNPDHLFLGTHRDNVADMNRKGRHGGWREKRIQQGR